MFALPSTVLLGRAGRKTGGTGASGAEPASTGLTKHYSLCARTPGKHAVPGGGRRAACGPRPGLTPLTLPEPHLDFLLQGLSAVTCWTFQSSASPALSDVPLPCLGWWECTREGPGKAVLGLRKDSLSGAQGTLGAISKQAEEVGRWGGGQGAVAPTMPPMSRAFSRLFLSLFSEKL